MPRRVARRSKLRDPIPEFASREEEARFWDTHDLADYWDEFKPVRVQFAKNISHDRGSG
ncbi:MAG: CopG family antitoxin [Dehalococcoidia bacterium]